MTMNTQREEPRIKDEQLDVIDVVPTIQGEGPYAGLPATFIRMAGCNLSCILCDTNYTVGRRKVAVEAVVQAVGIASTPGSKLVVITGGEPLRQDLAPLINALLALGKIVQIETNGSFYQDLPFDDANFMIVCCPKTRKVNHSLIPYIDVWKYVLEATGVSTDDGLPTSILGLDFSPARPPADVPPHEIYLQPVDVDDPREKLNNIEAVLTSSLKYGYRISLQMHKLLEMP